MNANSSPRNAGGYRVSRVACSFSPEQKQKNGQYGIDNQGRAGLGKAFYSANEQISENGYIPSREYQNRQRKLTGRLFLSRCHKRNHSKSQRVLPVEQSQLGIRQRALRDLLEYSWRKDEHHAEDRQVSSDDVQSDLEFPIHGSIPFRSWPR